MPSQTTIILAALDEHLNRDPAQRHNVAAIKKLVLSLQGKPTLLSGWRNTLYAIGGRAGLADNSVYVHELHAAKKKDPNVLSMTYCWGGQLMAGNLGSSRPLATAPGTTSRSSHAGTGSSSARQTAPVRRPAPQAQLAQYAYYDKSAVAPQYHEMLVEFRFPPDLGGDGTVRRIVPTVHDTGSTVQSLRRSDWDALNVHGVVPGPGVVLTAAGMHAVENVIMDIRVVKAVARQNAQGRLVRAYEPLTVWFSEVLRIIEDADVVLSGAAMRDYLYFAMAPGNERLLVAQRKQAIVDGLPTVQPPLP